MHYNQWVFWVVNKDNPIDLGFLSAASCLDITLKITLFSSTTNIVSVAAT